MNDDHEYEYLKITHRKIVQIMPCQIGTRAVYRDGESFIELPVLVFALCECQDEARQRNGKMVRTGDVYREVCGMQSNEDEGMVICEEASNFVRYLAPHEELVDESKTKEN